MCSMPYKPRPVTPGPARTPPSPQPRAYRVNDFCAAYGIGRTTLYKLLKDGDLTSVSIGGRTLILADAAEKLFTSAGSPPSGTT